MSSKPPAWASELSWLSEDDRHLPVSLDAVNLVLNRARLAAFLGQFAEDKDVRDLLALDLLGTAAGLPLSSTGMAETAPSLASRPFRLWEYVWLYKVLGLSAGGMMVLDLGGPATHLSILAAIAGCHVTSVDINPEFVHAADECARALKLKLLKARLGDMRDLSQFPAGSFDIVISCSVLEHLTARDQGTALKQIARVLKPTGLVGLTFDYGPPAPGANEHLQPPHAPPESAAGALRRYSQDGLAPAGNSLSEDPIPGCLFRHDRIRYTIASLFLAKAGQRDVTVPRCELAGSALGRLVIRELPYRVYKGIERTGALIDQLRGTAAQLERIAAERLAELGQKDAAFDDIAAEAERRREHLEQAVSGIGEREERIAGLESTAAERLAAMQDRDRETEAREQRIAELESTAAERLAAMQDRDRETEAREQRIAGLESTAAERLAAMQDRDREIQAREQRIAELESTAAERLAGMKDRDRETEAREQRIAELESTAAERLAGMKDRDREIQAREQRIAKLESTAAERLAAMQDRDREIQAREQRIAELESTAAERLAAMKDRDRETEAREQRIAELESTAAERLAAMKDRDRETEAREQRIAELESTAAERLAAMQDRDRKTEAREQRIAELESTAAERLAAMQDRDLLISRLHAEIESRDHAIYEIARRADALESTADEHLAALVARDQVIATLQTELQALHESLDAALAAIAEGQTRAAALEQDMEQMTALQSSLEVERASLIREKDTLSQHISRLEKEGLRDYLSRRYNRDRAKPRRDKAR